MARCKTCDSHICGDCSEETDVIDWSIERNLREAIWGIYGKKDTQTAGEWSEKYMDQVIPEKMIDDRYMINVKAQVSYYYIEGDEEHWRHKTDFEVSLPYVIGLSKKDFNEDCTMKWNSPYWHLYEPTSDETPPYSFENGIEFSNIEITVVHKKKKNLLDLTLDD